MANQLPTSLFQYPESDQKRFMIAFESLPFELDEKAAVLRQIENWLRSGVQAPTARESATGWYKRFDRFGVEGEGGSVYISRIVSLKGLHRFRGVNLDEWKAPKT